MKRLIPFIFLIVSTLLSAQSNTEIYLTDIQNVDGKIELTNLKNISNNEDYDNQPSFYDDDSILFSSTRNGQTDIALYNLEDGSTSWISDTPSGSEYSPLKIPNKDAVSAIRLDSEGLQRLYHYDVKSGKSEELLKDLKVGYHVWYSEDVLVCSVLVEDGMDLVVANLKDGTTFTAQKNVGRSLHKIPNTNLVSFIDKESDWWMINSLDPVSMEIKEIVPMNTDTEDMCWMPNGAILIPNGKLIAQFPPNEEAQQEFWRFQEREIHNISRMAASPNGKQFAFVSEEAPEKIVQKQVESYNAGNLDAFVNCYAENVIVSNFPADTLYVGHEKMRENYNELSPEKKVYDVTVAKRITIGSTVIDHEKVLGNGKTQMQVAIYQVVNDAISSMTFIFEDTSSPDPEKIVDKQLEAYNSRDIDAFLATYTEDVKVYDYPNKQRYQGQENMRSGYTDFFKRTTDLNCEIKNRIVIGNKVIDEEYLTMDGHNFSAVAIYEVENGKISKVTFVR